MKTIQQSIWTIPWGDIPTPPKISSFELTHPFWKPIKRQKGAMLYCQTLTEDTSMRPIVASVDETEIEILAKHC